MDVHEERVWFLLGVRPNQAKVTEGSGLEETTKEEPGWRFLSTLI